MGQSLAEGVKVMKTVIVLVGSLLFSAHASSDAVVSNSMAKMAMRQSFNIPIKEMESYVKTTKTKRALTDTELKFKDLVALASLLKIETVNSYHSTADAVDSLALISAITLKVQESPKWDKPLAPSELGQLKAMNDSLKSSFKEKSYLWAWVLKQKGDQAGAKKILSQMFQEGSEEVMKIKMLHFGNNPVIQLEFVFQALGPLSTPTEIEQNTLQMQKMKKHVSNLPDSMMMT